MLVPEISYYINLGFWYLKLLVILSFPVIGYVIRCKWRFAVAKEAEIKRLMLLAAEEASRAELEAAEVGYFADMGVKRAQKGPFVYCPEFAMKEKCAEGEVAFKCAVCMSPTTTRCSRCKSIRYCSAKCQIFHWREGHKDKCHPPSVVNQTSDAESYQRFKAYNNQEKEDTLTESAETEDKNLKNSPAHLEGNAFSGVGHMEKLQRNRDTCKADIAQDVKSSNSTASFNSSFSSSSSSSAVNSDSSDDASTSESSGSSNLKKSNARQLADDSIVIPASEIKPSALKGNSTLAHSKWNGTQTISNRSDSLRTSYTTNGLNVKGSDLLVAKSGTSDFWVGTLDYRWSESIKSKSQSTNVDLADIGSSVLHLDGKQHFSFSRVNEPSSGEVSNSSLPYSKKDDRFPSGNCRDSKPRCSSASNEDGNIHGGKEDNACPSNNVPMQTANRSSLFGERLGRALQSTESDCTLQSLKSRLVGNLPSNTHSSLVSGGKVASSVSKVDMMKSNSKVASSDKSCSLKVANGLKNSTWKAVDHFKASKLSRQCGADESHDNKGLFSYELFKSLYGWKKVELQPCGLVNLGNSCYANVVLQCLSFTPPLTAYLLQRLHSRSCKKRDWCFTCEFENLVLMAKDGNSPISPIGIISELPNIGSHLSNGREEDAHEFLRYVVDTMQSICIKEAANKMSSTEEESTLLGLTFGGSLQSKIRCLKCGSKSERTERIMDLSVEIEGIGSLEEALNCFTFSETLDAENKYNCARCKSYQKAKKKLTILEAPNILTIALKRFQVGKFGKLNKWIDFPEILDMADYMSRKSDDKAPVFKLYGVIVHLDTMNATFSGHYVCYVKNIQNKWFKIDDSVVKTVDFRTVKEQAAYMLLYARCLPRAPKSLRDKSICKPKSKATPQFTGHSPIASGPVLPNFNYITSSEAYCSKRHVNFETDSYSDNSSLFSSCSECSCSTDSSIRESDSTDEFSDLIFGHSGRRLKYQWKVSSESDSSSPSTSPFCFGHHQSHMNGGVQFLCSDPSSHCRNVDPNCSRSSNLRQPETERLT